MMLTVWQWLAASLLCVCLASFAWGMRKFFVKPAGETAGMKAIQICGSLSAALHLVAIVFARGISIERNALAAGLYIAALGLFWWAVRCASKSRLSAAFSPDAPVRLVEEGPYRFIRHPFYSSYLLAWFAAPVATAQIWLLPAVALMLAIYLKAAAQEEKKFSLSPLAGAYGEYRSRTGSFIPNPLKLLARTARRDTAKRHATGLAQHSA